MNIIIKKLSGFLNSLYEVIGERRENPNPSRKAMESQSRCCDIVRWQPFCKLCEILDIIENDIASNPDRLLQSDVFELEEADLKKVRILTEEIADWVKKAPSNRQDIEIETLDELLQSPVEVERVGLSKEAMALLTLTNYIGDSA